ncbi:MAG TPA: S-methyl-5-thioribose-1-phosphate isomerase [Polyangiaceae bacterium]|nr:S-methyl-5-thioribose-1-phosphate isomerase [Polyangiaceae bacterium]
MQLPHPEPLSGAGYSAAELALEDDAVILLDQRKLPVSEEYLVLRDAPSVIEAIKTMVVRGAPAIGVAAAYGFVVGARTIREPSQLAKLAEDIASARPTAVNLRWAIERCLQAVKGVPAADWVTTLAREARAIHREDVQACRTMGRLGAAYIPDGATVLTHCNAGALATGGYGTALGVVRAAVESGKKVRVLADETRPLLQGTRLTAWELHKDGIPVEVIADNSAAFFMARGEITAAVVGSDRIAANGDVANKIGTYQVALSAAAHDVPFYVAAPWSTVDMACASGAAIPIEARIAREVTHYGEQALTPAGVGVRNPAFDVTPARLVRAIFCERGVVTNVSHEGLQVLAAQRNLG